MMRNMRGLPVSLLLASVLLGTSPGFAGETAPDSLAQTVKQLNEHVPELLKQHKVAGVGIGLIEDGKVTWTGYFGEQGPGIAVTASTVFNLASVAKTLTSETLIALAAKGLISLDDPIHVEVSHPDLEGDPRYRKLTPRLLLTHRAGLLNWPYVYEDGKAAFIADPGTSFSYSGMGIELAAQYAENKLKQDFEALAFEHVLEPLGISEMAMGRIKPWMHKRLAMPMDNEGRYFEIANSYGRLADENNDGSWSGADDLLTTVDAYAQLLAGVIDSGWLEKKWQAERIAIYTSLKGDSVWNCMPGGALVCPDAYGHGLGWMVYQYGDRTIVKHGGNDAGENALALYSPQSRAGLVIMVNGGNGIMVSTQILSLLPDQAEIAAYYRNLIKKYYKIELTPLAGPVPESADGP